MEEQLLEHMFKVLEGFIFMSPEDQSRDSGQTQHLSRAEFGQKQHGYTDGTFTRR